MTSLLITIAAAVFVLGLLIFVHELGHFLVAKASNVKVLRFSLGFGPRVFGRTVGETEYVLSLVPLGGYVKMLGEEDAAEEGVLAEPERSFAHQSLFRRFAIVFAGPFFNLVSAWLCLIVVAATWGVLEPAEEPKVGRVVEDHPAHAAGLLSGDQILTIDAQPVATWDKLSERVTSSGGKPLDLVVQRGTEQVQITVAPEKVMTKNLFGEEVGEFYRIGVERATSQKVVSWPEAPGVAFRQTVFYGEVIILGIVKMVQGKVSTREIGGPITIAREAGARAQAGMKGLLE
ncbi:MAG: M50 family metallopeptidase, partial [Candidatus Binatia bacterium]